MVQFDADNLRIARPSELLGNVKTTMATLRGLENFTGVDMARLFNHVLLQQTQPEDSQGAITITNMYSTWLVVMWSLIVKARIELILIHPGVK
ncbi:PREDICTED: nck-associated protein 1 homolog [Acropora digitifera]|uniref:nck-associated protein 1 homolog n=1 Tax=Acropora digitifera TaxID=70779 RepID=UPI00077A04CF|nr:PREDICTED: nck-associated protein 1 homolog [Acropora digitifera]